MNDKKNWFIAIGFVLVACVFGWFLMSSPGGTARDIQLAKARAAKARKAKAARATEATTEG